ncbi:MULTISPECIES: DUF2332 domain-containing protein [unclassified Pseudonocardia]|uniref:DUF2332 domain-containing protein n=1 Tax=unclassified Pseudonocardia TaxID=2619320 RepID=UPI00095EF823|nr:MULTISPECIES: DUF2332 domain-containing protein [unclassified Pseudonocardia]MBN9102094.1 DUF2332 domain-containing protein [Pseudonocardia sp.]OJY39122.1 MAG: hypothetical protein BGP03_02695 [Pseudonocardia sp. 73-21]
MPSARDVVAGQARAIAHAWSPPGAPEGWWLTAATFAAIAEHDELLDLAVAVPSDRLPPLLLAAAVGYLAPGTALGRHYPRPGGPQPPRDPGFGAELAAFAREHAPALAALCAGHRYQMNEVGRCADVLPVLATIAAGDHRPLAVVDLGTGAGLTLGLDRYHYTYLAPDGSTRSVGDPASPVRLECPVRTGAPPVPAAVPVVVDRVGVDVEPLDLGDPATHAWLAACVPPEAGAVTRFAAAAELARENPARSVRGDLLAVLTDVVASIPPDVLPCLVDTYVHVFLPPADLERFDRLLDGLGRDVEWVSVDPLVPLGPEGSRTVQGLDVPPEWVADNRDGGVFGVVGRVSVRDGVRTGTVLGRAHPGAAWLDWTG